MRNRSMMLSAAFVLACASGSYLIADQLTTASASSAIVIAQAKRQASEPATVGLAPASAVVPTNLDADAKSSDAKPAEVSSSDTDRLIVDANALRARYAEIRRGRSRQPIRLYEVRGMAQRLGKVAEADPGNKVVAELAGAMQMIQAEMLGPAVQRSMVVKRKLFASRAGQDGMKVSVEGPGNTTARFLTPRLSRQAVLKLGEDRKIFEQLRMLDFRSAVFTDGRNRYTYNVAAQRLR